MEPTLNTGYTITADRLSRAPRRNLEEKKWGTAIRIPNSASSLPIF